VPQLPQVDSDGEVRAQGVGVVVAQNPPHTGKSVRA
jgi:hypothetical protein